MKNLATSPNDVRYVDRRFRLHPLFWTRFVSETLTMRHVWPLVRVRLGRESVTVYGVETIPISGAFVLAVNHYNGRAALDLAAAVLHAVKQTRPDAVESMLFIVGRRESRKPSLVGALVNWVYACWSGHALRIPLKNALPSAAGLRDWRSRNQPVFVFPEGRARLHLGRMRRGSGRWLSALDLPVVPIGAWWVRGEGWQVHFGKPIQWTHHDDLRDVQLGLALASLLPPDLAPDWQRDLERWREVHAKNRTTA